MLLKMEDFEFLTKTTVPGKDGKLIAKDNLSEDDKAKLLDIDEANYMTHEEHLVSNYKELSV